MLENVLLGDAAEGQHQQRLAQPVVHGLEGGGRQHGTAGGRGGSAADGGEHAAAGHGQQQRRQQQRGRPVPAVPG